MKAEQASLRTALLIAGIAIAGIGLRYVVFRQTETTNSFTDYMNAMCVWDCAWYRTIAEGGYDLEPGLRYRPGAANWAFFPMSPVIAGFVSRLTTLPVNMTGFVLSNVYAAAAALVARPLFDDNAKAYWLYVVMVLVGPFSFLFSSLHTEALFILLTTLAFVALKRSNYVLAGAFVGLLSATRLTGILMIFAIVASAIIDQRRAGAKLRDLPRLLLGNRQLLLGLALAPLGLLSFMTYLRLHVGDGLAFLHIQRAWGRSVGNPMDTLEILADLNVWASPQGMVNATWAAAAVFGLALSAALALRHRVPEALFCALVILVSLAGGTTSMVRFVAGLAPLGMMAAELLASAWIVRAFAYPVTVAAGIVLTVGWLNSSLFAM